MTTSGTGPSLSERVKAIRVVTRGDLYIEAIKLAVRNELQELDPSVIVKDTHYFNHSAYPDLVLSWAARKSSRAVYLRGSYASILAARDPQLLRIDDPILLSLDSRKSSDPAEYTDSPSSVDAPDHRPIDTTVVSPEILSRAISESKHSLLTDVEALGVVRTSGPAASAESPLAELVRSNFSKGAKGFVDTDRAQALVQPSAGGSLALSDVITESFESDAAVRLLRTAEIMDAALGNLAVDQLKQRRSGGHLSVDELITLVPWLLEHAGQDAAALWDFVGSLMNLKDLESISNVLVGRNLDPILIPNLERWVAARAYAGLSIENDDSPTPFGWRLRGAVIGFDFQGRRISFSGNGRTLRGKESNRLPVWDEVAEQSSAYQLQGVVLRGISRSIKIDAEQSDDIRDDVASITTSVDDRYVVSSVQIKYPGNVERDPRFAEVDFARDLVLTTDDLSLRELAFAATRLLTPALVEADLIQSGVLGAGLQTADSAATE